PKPPNNAKRKALPTNLPGVKIVRVGTSRKIKFGGTGYEVSIARGRDLYILRRLIHEGGFDVIHYHTMWTPFLPLQVFIRSPAANVATFHDTTARTPSGLMLRMIFRSLSKRLLRKL